MKQVTIYTDGACLGNPGPGGWAAILQYQKEEKSVCGGEAMTTNNRMEMTAAIQALCSLSETCSVRLCTDSIYLKDGITKWIVNWKRNGWRTAAKKPVKNQDLWQELDELVSRHEITWDWIKGHSGNPYNEECDRLANEQAYLNRGKS